MTDQEFAAQALTQKRARLWAAASDARTAYTTAEYAWMMAVKAKAPEAEIKRLDDAWRALYQVAWDAEGAAWTAMRRTV